MNAAHAYLIRRSTRLHNSNRARSSAIYDRFRRLYTIIGPIVIMTSLINLEIELQLYYVALSIRSHLRLRDSQRD